MNRNSALKMKECLDEQISAPKRYTLHLLKAHDDAFTKQTVVTGRLPKEEDCRDRATD